MVPHWIKNQPFHWTCKMDHHTAWVWWERGRFLMAARGVVTITDRTLVAIEEQSALDEALFVLLDELVRMQAANAGKEPDGPN